MIQTGIKLKSIVEFLKEYLSVLIIIPAFIGGLWQAIELMSISIPYLRFFSISQIVPDGILILVFLIIVLSYNILAWFADILFFDKVKSKNIGELDAEQYEKHRKLQLTQSAISFIIIYTGWFILMICVYNNQYNYVDFKSFILSSFFLIYILNNKLEWCYYYSKEKHKKYFKACNILLLILYIYASLYICKSIHNVFLSPSNIINIEQVKIDVSNKFPNAKQEILYFNDKYIFFKIIHKLEKDKKGKIIKHTSQKIYIIKLESLFDDK